MSKFLKWLQRYWPTLFWSLYYALRQDIIDGVDERTELIIIMQEKARALHALIEKDDTESNEWTTAWTAFETALNNLVEGK